jgi:hypothetical protein
MTALLVVVMMLTLTLASSSRPVHDWLHGDSSHETDHHCAVELFASGVTLAFGALPLSAPNAVGRAQPASGFQEVFLVSPRYLRQPERGPPIS